MKRRMLSALLALLMVLTLLPTAAMAEETATSGIGGESVTWEFDEATGKLTFSGSGEMDSYASGTPAPWLVWSKDITTVVIESGITSIGGCAFVDCTALTSVSIPETVTHIWDGAFARCSSLYDVTIPESIVNVGNSAFEDCISLKMMTIRGSNINVGHAAFKNCAALEKITLGAGVREIGWYTFQNCTALKQIAFEGDAPGYISADAFIGVTADAYYPEGNETWTDEYKVAYGGSLTWKAACLNHSYTEGVCTACGMEDPEKIIEPDVPAAPDSCGENAVWSFDEATGTLTISGEGPMADYEGQIYLPWKDYLQQITTVVVEPGITSVGNMAFCGMFSLTKVTLPDGLTRIGDGAFSMCMALEEITLPNSLVEIGSQAFDSTAISTVTIPANVETIGHMAFAYCDQLTTVRFEGDAPVRPGGPLFSMVTATAYYPAGNSTWTEEIRQAISGVDSITWVAVEMADVLRIAGADRIATSLKLADQLKETLGVDKFGSVIVASALNFPDALTGSYLAAVKDAPILLTYDDAHTKVRAYIEANLTPGGTVYILGGESAVSADFAAGLSDFNVKRVAGSDRFGTNLEILREAGVTPEQEILICTATGFADSLSASAASLPILLVHNTLSQEQQAFLATTSGKFVIIGGEAAVSARLEAELDALGDVERVGGANRYETSVLVAKRFVPNPDAVLLAYARNYPDGLCGGPLAVNMNAALILTDNYAPGAADAYVDGISSGIVVGGTGLISDEAVISVFDLNADILIPAK